MQITIELHDKSYPLDVPDYLLGEASDFFAKLDHDMDHGWQMSRWWVPDPDTTQRCQIVADKLLTAIQNEENEFAALLCAYILHSMPAVRRISINTDGEIQGTSFHEQ